MSTRSPASSLVTPLTRVPRTPTQVPIGSTRLSCDSTAILAREPGSREQDFALGVADFLQDDLLGGLRANAANRHAFHRLLDVVALFDVGDFLAGIAHQFFGFRVLQTGLVRHDQPAAEGFVVTAVAINR